MYVITGATGHTGNLVAQILLEHHQPVRVIGRSLERLQALAAKGAEPVVADLADVDALTRAFSGASAAYVMLPPNLATSDYLAFQRRITDAASEALAHANVRHAVTLSSIGADKPSKTGPVTGLYHLEQRLNSLGGLNVLHLRAGYFMGNTLAQIGMIRSLGKTGGPLRPELVLPMIAARDIAAAAADALLRLDFADQQTRELLGQRDLTMTEAAAIIGTAIGQPDLAYVQLPDEQVRAAMTQMGLSPNGANLILEMSAALNSQYMQALEDRSLKNTTLTSFEQFVEDEFVPAYEGQLSAV